MTAGTPYDGSPVAALRRIAFLLERGRADTYKVQAYRKAAAAILPLPHDEVARRAAEGTLTELAGVGSSTARVIAEAVAGRLPTRLAEAEEQYGALPAAGGEVLRAALRGDLHSHSNWSDGGSPIEEMAMTAMELGHDYLVLTDHSPRLTIARGLSAERLARQLEVVEAVNAHLGALVSTGSTSKQFRLLKGIEVDILDDGGLDQTEEMLSRLEVRVASVHSKLKMDPEPMTRRMVAAIRNPWMNVLGHCTGRLVTGNRGTRAQSRFDARAVFEAAAEHDVAIEINSRPERRDPPTELMELARDIGCLFSIDSDAHAPGQLDFLTYGCERAEKAGIDPDRIVNTWPVEKLLSWAGGNVTT
ncbi:PHP domain-containing protein [Nocardioides antri]|uniref:PHP domain-containing protein n=1 Tax=Nocardioides antri TaxID=2607659 RepID=A0A5B1M1A6_9ACTN|nr:PHP domain-containing protein [Nocardioides antri]KAA1426925.1 PHP domain-containing protein [Nocardioides antri]